jgi:hypothetical protein
VCCIPCCICPMLFCCGNCFCITPCNSQALLSATAVAGGAPLTTALAATGTSTVCTVLLCCPFCSAPSLAVVASGCWCHV